MTLASQRKFLRYLHLAIGGLVGTYIYSPWGADPTFALLTKTLLLPLVAATGIAMWQQARLRRFIRP